VEVLLPGLATSLLRVAAVAAVLERWLLTLLEDVPLPVARELPLLTLREVAGRFPFPVPGATPVAIFDEDEEEDLVDEGISEFFIGVSTPSGATILLEAVERRGP
jgi:hypothetical protein